MTRPASFLRFLSLLSLLLLIFSPSYVAADSHFEGFEAEEDDVVEENIDHDSFKLTDLPLTRSDSPLTSVPEPTSENSEVNPSSNSDSQSSKPESDQSKPSSPPSTTSFDYWDEDEFEGLPVHQSPPETPKAMESAFHADNQSTDPKPNTFLKKQQSYTVEIVHDLIARIYNMIVPCKDEITFEVYMNDDAMDHVVFALAKKKAAKGMQKEVRDLQRFAVIVAQPPSGRRWVSEELGVISESKEVAGDLITETVLEQFALPDANNMADMTRLIALVPYYIDVIGRYKLSSQARSKTEAARSKAAQEVYKELQNARQEALQKKKAERKKMQEEAEAKLSAEAVRKKEAKACSSDEEGYAKNKDEPCSLDFKINPVTGQTPYFTFFLQCFYMVAVACIDFLDSMLSRSVL
ncbi:hypothetical protein GH714_020806 [Hevea brasiliensis]|uniref:Uncharacterized protein n=1 Tax=Hevea brasiliensis TaxID=3981 RepID=A0A6A6N3Q1_HEVBR|nr:hypothetical protein GH714_020806 [Hevea brasiliensis]